MEGVSDMELFVRVVDAGSLAKAGAELGVSRTTVGRRLKKIEQRLAVKLLNVSTRQLGLTDAGRLYYERGKRLVSEIAETETLIAQQDGTPRGLLRITGPPGISVEMIGPLLTAFTALHPGVTAEYVVTTKNMDLVAEGFHVAMRIGPLSDSNLYGRHVWSDRFGLFASKAYLDERGRPRSAEDLSAHDAICGFDGNGTPRTRWRLRSGSTVRVTPRLCCNSILVLRHAVLDHLGIAGLPESLVADLLQTGGVERVLPDVIGADVQLNVVMPARSKDDPKVAAFVDYAVPRLRAADLAQFTLNFVNANQALQDAAARRT